MIVFTYTLRPYNGLFIIDLKHKTEIIWETEISDGLFVMNHVEDNTEKRLMFADAANNNQEFTLEWHRKTCHLRVDRYPAISKALDSVPHFRRSVLDGMTCISCSTGNAERIQIASRPRSLSKRQHLEILHMELSGKLFPSL